MSLLCWERRKWFESARFFGEREDGMLACLNGGKMSSFSFSPRGSRSTTRVLMNAGTSYRLRSHSACCIRRLSYELHFSPSITSLSLSLSLSFPTMTFLPASIMALYYHSLPLQLRSYVPPSMLQSPRPSEPILKPLISEPIF